MALLSSDFDEITGERLCEALSVDFDEITGEVLVWGTFLVVVMP